jgi:3-deoxy-7-phosphoheptulonate synthase
VLSRVREETGLALVAEVPDLESAQLVAGHVDVLQVGPENMQNFSLLNGVARLGTPVLLVRGPSATLTELLMSAEYVLAAGNDDAILCEVGVRALPPEARTLLDLTAVPLLKSLTHLPIVVAPGPTAEMASAAVAAGADGLVLEPAASRGADALDRMLERARRVAPAMGRELA